MKHKHLALAAVAAALIAAMSIAPAQAYFTDYHRANGMLRIKLEPTTDIDEEYGERTKHVHIHNSAESDVDVYVRARVYSSLPVDIAGTNWSGPNDEGWYEYSEIVPIGKDAEELTVTITFPDGATEGDNYNVIVVYESTPVQYKSDGTPYADWSYILDREAAKGGE
jgi:hypothetical protein